MQRRVVAMVTDLLDRSKFPDGTRFVRRLGDVDADVVVVDLSVPGAVDGIAVLRAAGSTVRVVAYGRHTATELLAEARRAGADRVLARSAFFADVAAALS
jgi:DNA-binding NarL/FixJ family response regulator